MFLCSCSSKVWQMRVVRDPNWKVAKYNPWAFLVGKTHCVGFDSLEKSSWNACSSTVQVALFLEFQHFNHWPADTLNFLENIFGRRQEETKVDGNVNKNFCFLKRVYNLCFKYNEVRNFIECFQFQVLCHCAPPRVTTAALTGHPLGEHSALGSKTELTPASPWRLSQAEMCSPQAPTGRSLEGSLFVHANSKTLCL